MSDREKRPTGGSRSMGMMGGPMNMGGGAKAKDFKGTLKTLIAYLSVYKVSIIFVVIFSIGSTVFSILGPKILGNATQEIFNGVMSRLSGGTGINFTAVGKILLWLVGLYAVSALFSYIQGFVMTGVSQKVTYNLRKALVEKIGRMPMRKPSIPKRMVKCFPE